MSSTSSRRSEGESLRAWILRVFAAPVIVSVPGPRRFQADSTCEPRAIRMTRIIRPLVCRAKVQALLRPPIEIRRRAAASGDVGIGVDELVGGELVDRARLRLALPVGEG